MSKHEVTLSLDNAKTLASLTEDATRRLVERLRRNKPNGFSEQPMFPNTFFDLLGLSIALKELITIGDIRLLVEHNRFDGANARLRSTWESLIILGHAIYCTPDKEDFAKAAFLHDAAKRLRIIKQTGYSAAHCSTEEIVQDEQTIRDEDALPRDVKESLRRSVEEMHRRLLDAQPDFAPKMKIGSIEMHQYDLIFRQMSLFVHGGVSGNQVVVNRWLERKVQNEEDIDFDSTGLLVMSSSLLEQIIRSWMQHTTSTNLPELWDRCTAELEKFKKSVEDNFSEAETN
jgi:hypothetical protein